MGDRRIPLDGYVFKGAPASGAAVLGIRPEHVRVGAGESGLSATVEMVEPMGADSLVWSRLADGSALSSRDAAETLLKPGDPLPVAFPADSISLFDAASGDRL